MTCLQSRVSCCLGFPALKRFTRWWIGVSLPFFLFYFISRGLRGRVIEHNCIIIITTFILLITRASSEVLTERQRRWRLQSASSLLCLVIYMFTSALQLGDRETEPKHLIPGPRACWEWERPPHVLRLLASVFPLISFSLFPPARSGARRAACAPCYRTNRAGLVLRRGGRPCLW